jgi:hypothetical protein
MKKIILELTDEEAKYVSIQMNIILRDFGNNFTNKDMASGLNKVFKSLSGRNHENCKDF